MSSQESLRSCPNCGQKLRFPDVGGVLMACPVCGHRFISPFRLAGANAPSGAIAKKSTVRPDQPQPVQPTAPPMAAISDPTPTPTAAQSPAARALAARVAAIYAKKAS